MEAGTWVGAKPPTYVSVYFQFLSMEKMQKKQEETLSNYTDPYKTILPKMKTVPYILTVELPWMN